ncbi:hypothetical protein PROFUN_15117 [Planoprotostelium fungivorum]|uniref:PARG catalytic Macro domain-containing protein n=1 Tax=Planoprotostelium fungivorum TaxID=1890364 RepID=A0A2P6MZW6_9EUKA|nr:hypothetical protein PROFUN_15117 [Planoprotostelium fungivorum]
MSGSQGLPEGCLVRVTKDSKKLWKNFRPKMQSSNKRLLLDMIDKEGEKPQGDLIFERWSIIQPSSLSLDPERLKGLIVEETLDIYRYQQTDTEDYYVNFADASLFGFYGGPLFAQDEHQVAEHPILGSLRRWLDLEAASETKNKEAIPWTKIGDNATPCLIFNAQRSLVIETQADPTKGRQSIYGNSFSYASPATIRAATTVITKETAELNGLRSHNNFIAIEAPKHGHGTYDRSEIEYIFFTAFSGFEAARLHSGDKTVIHTGNWGCGAFGGNGSIMAMLQIAAAAMSGVKKIVYHTFDQKHTRLFREGQKKLQDLWNSRRDLHALLAAIQEEEYQWGVGNGT